MQTKIQYLLGCLAEESAEVGQRAIKAVRFGLDEVQRGQNKTNFDRLDDEVHDLIAVYEMLHPDTYTGFYQADPDNGLVFNRDKINYKKQKMMKYYEYSKSLGEVE